MPRGNKLIFDYASSGENVFDRGWGISTGTERPVLDYFVVGSSFTKKEAHIARPRMDVKAKEWNQKYTRSTKTTLVDVERTRNMRRDISVLPRIDQHMLMGRATMMSRKKRILCDINKQISQVENRNEFSNINNERFNVRIERRDMLMNEKKRK